jgi:isocitrate dehydrogenase
MKQTDGLFHKVFDEVAAEYPELTNEHWIVDIGAAKLADTPEAFDVVVMPNLYGDILSDVAAQIAGSVGLAGSANIGDHAAMFEAIHGSAPRRAGQNLANPSGLLHGAILMLVHIGQGDVAERVHNAWLTTIEDGIHTYDIFEEGVSKQKVGTKEFAQAVVERIGRTPKELKAASYPSTEAVGQAAGWKYEPKPPAKKDTVGVDVFVQFRGTPDELGAKITPLDGGGLKLDMVSNRGQKVWPGGHPETFCVDHWRCRYMAEAEGQAITHRQILDLLGRYADAGLDFIKTENLCNFDGKRAYSADQG